MLKYLIRKLIYQTTRKYVRESSLAVCDIVKKPDDLRIFNLSTNPIISFEHEGRLYYFRECPRIQSADAYQSAAVAQFFGTLDRLGIAKDHFLQEIPVKNSFDQEEISTFQRYLEEKRTTQAFRKMLTNADRIAQRVHFSIWEKQVYDAAFFEAFGLEELPETCRNIAIYFLWVMRGAAGNYRLMKTVRGRNYSFFAGVKSVASEIVAQELDLAHLVTPAKWCRLQAGEQVYFGLLSPAAPGSRMVDTAVTATASLQRELLCLNVLDVICNQTDHGPNNYNVAVGEDGKYTVCAFDNDNPQTFFPRFTVSRSLAGCVPFVRAGNRIQRPYMDSTLAKDLRGLNEKKLRKRLKPYLNRLQIAAVCYRIRRLNCAIMQTQLERPDFLLEAENWNAQTVAEEINGKFGQTYLTKINSRESVF